jgi:hypothetical protein
MKERASETKKRDDEKAAAMKAAAMNEAKGAGYAKGGMVMKSKKSKKPRGSGCAARTKRTKKY